MQGEQGDIEWRSVWCVQCMATFIMTCGCMLTCLLLHTNHFLLVSFCDPHTYFFFFAPKNNKIKL